MINHARILTATIVIALVSSIFLPGQNSVVVDSLQIDTISPENVTDTTLIKRVIENKVNTMVQERVKTVDSIKYQLLDSIKDFVKPVFIKRWKGHIDIERRYCPNPYHTTGHPYKWIWWYLITKYGGEYDTAFDGIEVKRMKDGLID